MALANVIAALGTFANLVTVMIGFGLIITIHELGHFLAARWAGIRVLAFSVGFGNPIVSYRKGIGWRRGSSVREYEARLAAGADRQGLSPTEYRLAPFPLGGYVKMLGQDDLDPTAVSDERDSYQNAPVWKRMVVISAGVIFNIISAAALFIAVFMAGLETEPPVVGAVYDDAPAATAVPIADADAPNGLRPGDRVLTVEGERTRSFADVMMSSALAQRGDALTVTVERPGVEDPIAFEITPETSPTTGLLGFGFERAYTLTLADHPAPDAQTDGAWLAARLAHLGLPDLPAGSTVRAANGRTDLPVAAALDEVYRDSDGAPVTLTIETPNGDRVDVETTPRLDPQIGVLRLAGEPWSVLHVAGLTPAMSVAAFDDPTVSRDDPRQGLRPGDLFARIGPVEYPTYAEGIAAIRERRSQTVALEVLREGVPETVAIDAQVSRQRRVGFMPEVSFDVPAVLGATPTSIRPAGANEPYRPSAAGLGLAPGTRVLAVNGAPVETMRDVLTAIRHAVNANTNADELAVTLSVRGPRRVDGAEPAERNVDLALNETDRAAIAALRWSPPFERSIFAMAQTTLKAEGPIEAIAIGLHETRRIAVSVYVQFARLFQGSVKIEHIKGPVGIAHVGTIIAARGPVWLMFFLAMISVNLAVINFLPLPVVDGGQFLMLLYEQLRGRPVPVGVQNAVTLAGLALLAGVFVVATFNDVRALFGL